MTNVADFRASLVAAIDARIAYEKDKDADNMSMRKTLANIRKSADHDRIAEIMLASQCDTNRINRSERSNARYNVYAYEKDINIARSIARVNALNHYTRAIFCQWACNSPQKWALKIP
ncbi:MULTISPECIES: hypothetical protein [unclassified Chelatococcus]|uniref:hypothetical protein n=1 Tax=unclassified Chelatococcus TaxID=2638111 RepID=UPI001BCB79F9|nr:MULTISPECIES: hypothetical protein [unclassified Chelatococcus]MBS7701478.1 hypothetical protein [Chelatococcus sp. YT9]MBX3559208.1 hypothetical protein [Chelatococcus sp.]